MAVWPENARALTRVMLALALAGAALGGTATRLQDRDEPAANGALLERWNRLTVEERTRYRARFEEYRRKDPGVRAVMKERAKHLDLMARRLHGTLSEAERERLAGLPPGRRREILHEMLAAEARDVGRRIRESLPSGMRQRFDGARPEDRARFITSVRGKLSNQMGVVFERLGRELGLPPGRIQRLKDLPESQRRPEFLALLKRRLSRDLSARGLPAGISRDAWRQLLEMPPREFFDAILRLRETHPEIGLPHGGGRGPAPSDPETRRRLSAMRRAMQPISPAERLELSALSREERAAEVRRRKRSRVLEVIRSEGLLSEEELRALAARPDPSFFREVRELVSGRNPGHGPGQAPGGQRNPAPGGRRARGDGERP